MATKMAVETFLLDHVSERGSHVLISPAPLVEGPSLPPSKPQLATVCKKLPRPQPSRIQSRSCTDKRYLSGRIAIMIVVEESVVITNQVGLHARPAVRSSRPPRSSRRRYRSNVRIKPPMRKVLSAYSSLVLCRVIRCDCVPKGMMPRMQ